MHDIYSQASYCIAATAAPSGDVGLFFARNSWQNPVKIRFDSVFYGHNELHELVGEYWCSCRYIDPTIAISETPLNRRVWVMEERYLSTRLIHFTTEMVFWQYFTHLTNEALPRGAPYSHIYLRGADVRRTSEIVNRGRVNVPLLTVTIDSHESSKIYDAWYELRKAYSLSGMTKEEDSLVAIDGVAQDIGGVISDTLIAGLWESRMIADMCWFTWNDYEHTNRPLIWRAPSWS